MSIKVFFDCEFSDISRDAGLISIGFAAEPDAEPLYIELVDGWSPEECSTFVLASVLPLLGRHNPQQLARSEAAGKIEGWLDSLRGGDREKQIVCLSDGAWDWRFLLNLFSPLRRRASLAKSFQCGRTYDPQLFAGRFGKSVQ